MKNFILLFSLILSFSACSQNDEEKINDNSIVGTWKLIEKVGSGTDGLPSWQIVHEEKSYNYIFMEDGVVFNSQFNCNGTFEILSSNTLSMKFDCDYGKINGIFDFKFENQYLILNLNPNTCLEGCAEKFIKIN